MPLSRSEEQKDLLAMSSAFKKLQSLGTGERKVTWKNAEFPS